MKLDNIDKMNCSHSMTSGFIFKPEDIISNKKSTIKTKNSAISSNTLLNWGFNSTDERMKKYQVGGQKRLKNTRQYSEKPPFAVREQILQTTHKHHVSTGDRKLAWIKDKNRNKLEHVNEEELLKEVSNFMDPREILSIFSLERRDSPNRRRMHNREKALNSIQLSTLSTNPKKKENDRKSKYDESDVFNHYENLEQEERQALIEENSDEYNEVMLEDSGGVGPNEWMYFNVEPIPLSLMFTFEEAMQRQKEILDKSSRINNNIMPIWDSRRHAKNKFYKKDSLSSKNSQTLFDSLDTTIDINLKRMEEMSQNPQIITKQLNPNKILMGKLKSSISFATALIVIWNYDKKFSKSTLNGLIYPNKNEFPIINSCGFYGVKVRFNGAQRLVEVDDYLPVDSFGKPILWTHQSEFAPQLLEKAIVRLYGCCCEKINLNPSIEMHHFIGWIPETVKFSDVSNKENLWTRMKQNFQEGNIILWINSIMEDEEGTKYEEFIPKLAKEDSSLLAVLDIREFKDHKLIKWANPSGGFTSFDIYKPNETHSLTGELIEPVKLLAGTTRKIESVFWIDWDDILDHYNQINLCWNPNIYPFKKRIHSYWRNDYSCKEDYPNWSGKFLDEKYSVEYCPQFVFTIPPHKDDFEVRIFLQRHMNTFQEGSDNKYISFKLFSFDGFRVIYPDDNLRSFSYSNREMCSDVFIFENSAQDESYVLAILKGDNIDKTEECQFTLDVLSFIDIDIKELPEPVIEESYIVKGKWSKRHPGADLLSENAIYNPHYWLEVKEKIQLQIKAEWNKNKIMVVLLDGGTSISETPFSVITKNISANCYWEGFSWIEILLDPGKYTVALCTETLSKSDNFRMVFNLMENQKLNYMEDLVITNLSIGS
jgi:hypothetical protein